MAAARPDRVFRVTYLLYADYPQPVAGAAQPPAAICDDPDALLFLWTVFRQVAVLPALARAAARHGRLNILGRLLPLTPGGHDSKPRLLLCSSVAAALRWRAGAPPCCIGCMVKERLRYDVYGSSCSGDDDLEVELFATATAGKYGGVDEGDDSRRRLESLWVVAGGGEEGGSSSRSRSERRVGLVCFKAAVARGCQAGLEWAASRVLGHEVPPLEANEAASLYYIAGRNGDMATLCWLQQHVPFQPDAEHCVEFARRRSPVPVISWLLRWPREDARDGGCSLVRRCVEALKVVAAVELEGEEGDLVRNWLATTEYA